MTLKSYQMVPCHSEAKGIVDAHPNGTARVLGFHAHYWYVETDRPSHWGPLSEHETKRRDEIVALFPHAA